ncbi:hypothetical protein SAMN05421676_105244 [Salinibacillus kushneri]|uniref:Uncharacterized protein n=1 Tax=Salinibacillus kushneri TaxID=237682 RepID=A0A1I0FB69_9BACI|nr:hypothetical protein [Salinibacillus kushneri]SET54411.1 hypothetical protein SAMN05421676_105244 [Salinibacillus kushneri]
MEQDTWIYEQLQQLLKTTDDYNRRVLIKATQDLIKEQEKRIYQMEGEIEGTIWSPKRWGE